MRSKQNLHSIRAVPSSYGSDFNARLEIWVLPYRNNLKAESDLLRLGEGVVNKDQCSNLVLACFCLCEHSVIKSITHRRKSSITESRFRDLQNQTKPNITAVSEVAIYSVILEL